jgi:hypothetical protein
MGGVARQWGPLHIVHECVECFWVNIFQTKKKGFQEAMSSSSGGVGMLVITEEGNNTCWISGVENRNEGD